MKPLKITDDRAEMEGIGRDMVNQYPKVYTKGTIDAINQKIRYYMPLISFEERQKLLYRSVYHYWVYGCNIGEYLYLGFEGRCHAEKKEYMTSRWKFEYYGHLNDLNISKSLFANKFEAYKLLNKYYLREIICLEGKQDFDKFVEFVHKHPSFYVKPTDLDLGIGVHRIDTDLNTNLKELFDSLLYEGTNMHKDISYRKSNAIVLEEPIIQDAALAKIHPSSVNAIRLPTVRVNGKVHFYYPWLKTGVGGADIASEAMRGAAMIGIDAETGVLNTHGFGENNDVYMRHPDTGVWYLGYQIPKWKELIEVATQVAESLPESINYVGWDYVLTPKGWCIMEGNDTGAFMWQVFHQKGMRKDFEDLIGWKSEKQFWWE